MVIGSGIAKKLNLNIGDKLSIIISNNLNNKFLLPRTIELNVVDIISFFSQLDYQFAVVSLSSAQKYLYRENEIDGISINVKNIFNLEKIIKEIKKTNEKEQIKIETWISKYGYMYKDINKIRIIVYLSMFLMILISSSSIIIITTALVKRKKKDIAMLYTLGAKKSFIYNIFLCNGIFYGSIGSTIGVIFGLILSNNFNLIIKKIENLFNFKIISNKVYFIDFVPIKIFYIDIFFIFCFSFTLICISSLFSAIKIINSNYIKSLIS
ncbi:ycfW [Wigglesworthia glossinidia endosymbiont of Glossina brevipalpis]|uniref:YcfW protein n=1 Tax=Wigglesworthia glossinidia brevipalpis TaxID=36870 RepID=Q8D399_WIGBR|nr:ycfW [Wigglesworthia glossinidia endosymbiont of Glossina brevipalpis]